MTSANRLIYAAALIALGLGTSLAPTSLAAADIKVRGVPVGGGAGKATPDGALNMFVITPIEDRPLEARIALVEKHLAQSGTCRLGTTDRNKIRRWTRSIPGTGQKTLVAPIKC